MPVKPDPFVEATAESCATDIAEAFVPKLWDLRLKFGLTDDQFMELVMVVAGICRDAMIRTGEMAKDIAKDTLENG